MKHPTPIRTVASDRRYFSKSPDSASSGNSADLCFGGAPRVALGCVIAAIAAMLTAAVQSGFFSVIRPFGRAPDLCLALAVASGMLFGWRFGAVSGVAVGFFIDALSADGGSLNIPVYLLAGVISGLIRLPETRPIRDIWRYVATVGCACLVKQCLLGLWVMLTAPTLNTYQLLAELIGLQLICTTVFSFLVYLPSVAAYAIRRRLMSARNRLSGR